MEPRRLYFKKHSGDPDAHPSVRTTVLEELGSIQPRA